MSNRELRSLVEGNPPIYLPFYLHPSQTIYSKTLRSGTTYAQYRDVEEEVRELSESQIKAVAEEKVFIEKWVCHNGEPVARVSAEVLSEPEARRITMHCIMPPATPEVASRTQ
jgi:hypothetical protein